MKITASRPVAIHIDPFHLRPASFSNNTSPSTPYTASASSSETDENNDETEEGEAFNVHRSTQTPHPESLHHLQTPFSDALKLCAIPCVVSPPPRPAPPHDYLKGLDLAMSQGLALRPSNRFRYFNKLAHRPQSVNASFNSHGLDMQLLAGTNVLQKICTYHNHPMLETSRIRSRSISVDTLGLNEVEEDCPQVLSGIRETLKVVKLEQANLKARLEASRIRERDCERRVAEQKLALNTVIGYQEDQNETLTQRLFQSRGSFWIFIRFQSQSEGVLGYSVKPCAALTNQVVVQRPSEKATLHVFDRVFKAGEPLKSVVSPLRHLLIAMFEGFDEAGAIIVDGQSGSGKSFTMFEGPDNVADFMSNIVFDQIEKMEVIESSKSYRVECAVAEVYLGKVNDLSLSKKDAVPHSLVGGRVLPKLARQSCVSAADLREFIIVTSRRTHRNKTTKNDTSTRGLHLVQIAIIETSRARFPKSNESVKDSQLGTTTRNLSLCLLDLPGRERDTKETTNTQACGRTQARKEHSVQQRETVDQERRDIDAERSEILQHLRRKAGTLQGKVEPSRTAAKLVAEALKNVRRPVYISNIRAGDDCDDNTRRMASLDIEDAESLADEWLSSSRLRARNAMKHSNATLKCLQ